MARFQTDDEKLLVRRAYDKLELSEKRYTEESTGFLNELEQDILLREFDSFDSGRVVFSGGYEGAERRMLIFVPEYAELDESELICAIRCSYYKEYELTHRDFLGALMGLGIERETVGDIIVSKKELFADIVLKREMLQYVLDTFSSAGRASLNVKEIPLSELNDHVKETVVTTETVASPRFDAIVSCGFGISRDNASALIKSGRVFLDRRLVNAPDKTVTDGAIINSQGMGKFKVYITENVSKKGRIFIKIEKYV